MTRTAVSRCAVAAGSDALLGRVDVEHAPDDCAREHLAQRLRRFEAVAGRDRHPPGCDLGRPQLVEPVLTKGCDRAREQPAELLERHRGGFVLGEVLLAEGERPGEPVPAPQPLKRALEGGPRVLLAREAAALDSLRTASGGPIAVRPQLATVASSGCELEYLSLLDHQNLLVR